MAAPTYRIGPGDFFTGGDLAADADTLDAQVNALDAAMDGNEQMPQTWFDQWNVFVTRWRAFKNDKFGGFFSNFVAALNDDNRDELVSYERQFQTWASQASGYGISVAGGVIEEAQPPENHILPKLPSAGVVITVLVLVVVAAVVLK